MDGDGSRKDERRKVMAQHSQVSHSSYTLYNAPQPSQAWHFPLIFPVLHADTPCAAPYTGPARLPLLPPLSQPRQSLVIIYAAFCPSSMPAHPALHHTLRGSSRHGWVSLCCLCTTESRYAMLLVLAFPKLVYTFKFSIFCNLDFIVHR